MRKIQHVITSEDRARRILKATFGAVSLALAATAGPSCSSDSESSPDSPGACSLADNSGCSGGQVCRSGPDGVAACVCSSETGAGCPNGQVCAEADAGPACVACSVTTNAGCGTGMICAADTNGTPACVVCSTTDNRGCEGGQICVADGTGALACSCSIADSTGCPSDQICANDADGKPACVVCSTADNAGCPSDQICTNDADGKPACVVCSTADNAGCPSDQICAKDKNGVVGCFCDVTTKGGCVDGKVCLADADGVPACYCNTETEAGCPMDEVCEEVPGGYPTCFPPLTVGGMIFDLSTTQPIEGAHVVARDANFAAVSGVAVTDAAGDYTLTIPAPRAPDGTPIKADIFLRADAQTYLTFPTAPRVALPLDLSKATGMPPHLESSATDIGMIKLANSTGLGWVSGKVVTAVPTGTLVVAGGAANVGGGVTGIAGIDGSYTVFNVPAGPVTMRGYKVGLQLQSAMADVVDGAETSGIDLTEKTAATATVSGKVAIVNPGMGTTTSVILAVDETFVPNAARGEAPPGLRTAPVSGDFSISGVPDGNYVVLAAFENDFLVRDPDTSIGGTGIVHITVAGGDVAIADGFKITGSLDGVSPDGEQIVSGTPHFAWNDDSGENHYEVRVFDAYGNLVWEDLAVPGVSGNPKVEVDYAGPALVSGQLYQFRAVSIKNGGSPISITEDLKGVFLYK